MKMNTTYITYMKELHNKRVGMTLYGYNLNKNNYYVIMYVDEGNFIQY